MTAASIETRSKALTLRAILNQFSNISYSFAKLNKEYPIDELSEKDLKHLITAYEELLEIATPLVKKYDKQRPLGSDRNPRTDRHLGVAYNG
jgi:hypothetical protein